MTKRTVEVIELDGVVVGHRVTVGVAGVGVVSGSLLVPAPAPAEPTK